MIKAILKKIKGDRLNHYLSYLFFVILLVIIPLSYYPKVAAEDTTLEGHWLEIPKLEIRVPIIENISCTEKKEYFKALQGGVGHCAGTSLPGEESNIFIIGHSNFYSKKAGDYKKIFARLDRLKPKDQIRIYYQKQWYDYQVKRVIIVKPTKVEYAERTEKERLTLMTCWPPGSIKKRLIVICNRAN